MRYTGRLLFVDDEEAMREMVQIVLQKDGHAVDTAADGETALALFHAQPYDMAIVDLKMKGMDGLEILRRLREKSPETPVAIVTAFSTWETAVDAMRLGAYDYLKKPFDNDELRAMVQRGLRYRETISGAPQPEAVGEVRFIGSTPAIQQVLEMIKRVANTDSTVLVQGESGTGKELVARLLHLYSPRRAGPFISVCCGAFSDTLLESEIFGHVRGAFTGAVADKKGLLDLADGGSLFLDEVAEMSLQTQVTLLRVLETRTFLPVGGATPRRVDVRFVAATNRDLAAMVANRTFREDLYYRLNVIPITLPPLRERRDDIPLLAGHFLAYYSRAFCRRCDGFTPQAMAQLMAHDWPGNIRELQNVIQRAITLASGSQITTDDIILPHMLTAPPGETPFAMPEPGPSFQLDAYLEALEAKLIHRALEKSGGSLTKAAALLGISFRSIRYKVKKLGIRAEE